MTTITTRATKGFPLSWAEADANFTNLNDDKAEVSAVDLKAPLDSPSLTGVPTAPTAVNGTNTTQLATTSFVQGKTALQTPSTSVGNIAATNVQAALEELDTEKASLTGATFSGQVTATKLQTGVSGTNTNNFILDASAADGTMKLERGDGQDIMTVDGTGKVSFPQNTLVGFIATQSTIGLATSGVLPTSTEQRDDGNCFDTGTYKFQPAVTGWYSIHAKAILNIPTATYAGISIVKNGSETITQQIQGPYSTTYMQVNCSAAVYMNGSTDYCILNYTASHTGGTATEVRVSATLTQRA